MARLAWFSPVPPVRSGIAACSADLLGALGGDHEIDVFVDEPVVGRAPGTRSAHDFVWRHRQRPYDLTVYQIGNSSHHDYEWPYLLRYPGLVVLHDVQLHHARAAALLRQGRADAYRREFHWDHPDVSPDLAELAVSGFDNQLYYNWPMTRLLVEASRHIAVHSQHAADRLREETPAGPPIDVIRLGHGTALSDDERQAARARGRARLGLPADGLVFGCFGGLSPDKRIPQVLTAFASTLTAVPSARLLLAGAPADHLDLKAEIKRRGIGSRTIVTGYVESDERLTEYIAACDASLTLRWPTAGELSGPWLRCLALGLPTVIVDLAHLAHVPALDPRTWQVHGGATGSPVCIAVDILDEDHSLHLAMRRLAGHPALRAKLGQAAADFWQGEHSVERMVEDYRALIRRALDSPMPTPSWPHGLLDDGGSVLEGVTEAFGLPPVLR